MSSGNKKPAARLGDELEGHHQGVRTIVEGSHPYLSTAYQQHGLTMLLIVGAY